MFEAFGRGGSTAQSVSTVLIKSISQNVISKTRVFFLKKNVRSLLHDWPAVTHEGEKESRCSSPSKIEVQINAHLPRKCKQALGGGA